MQWVKECRNDHIDCRAKVGTRLPTRLLFISPDDVVLVEPVSQALGNLQYMTLSHRWPKSSGMKLTRNTRTLFEQGVATTTLPPLFRDVCELSASLGCFYIWIDALCIVQDDEQDWMREASSRADVYVHSQLNIIAGSSQQHESLFHERNLLMSTPCIIKGSKISQALDRDTIFTFSRDETGQIARLATNSRAWILQECQLSPRMVYFGDTELIWECGTKLQCESSQEGGVNWSTSDIEKTPQNLRLELSRFQQDHIGLTEEQCCSIWTGLVSKYTSTQVTLETDRLVAISGLSQYLQHEVKDQLGEYYAGLWEVGFEQQLIWRSYDESGITVSSAYLAPSWSWASHVSRIAYYGSPSGTEFVSSFVECLKISVTSVSELEIHGQLKDGCFTCLANICPFYLTYNQSSQNFCWSVETSASGATPSTRTQLLISVSLDQPNQIQAHAGSPHAYRDFFLLPLLCYDLSDHGQPYLSRPRQRRLFTAWRLESDHRLTSQCVFPKGRWRAPSEPEDHYAMAALILSPSAGQKGHYERAGIAEFGSPETISLLQQACRQKPLPSEFYVKTVPDRHAYEIVVV